MSTDAFLDLVERHTAIASPPACPEIRTREAGYLIPIWEEAEKLAGCQVEPPFWAYSWAGSQALARYILDHPDAVRSKSVLDLGSGNGLASIACALVGALRVVANDIDPHARRMTLLHAQLNGLQLETEDQDLLGLDPPVPPFEVILAGDLFYSRDLSARVEPWLRAARGRGAAVLIGDPGRAYLPRTGIRSLVTYEVPVPPDIESVSIRRPSVLCLEG